MADRQTKELDPVKESPISGLPEILELYDETMIPVQQEDTAMHMTGKQFREFGEKTAEMYVQTAVDAAESASTSAEASEAARSASEEAAKKAADKLSEVQQAGEEALGNIEEQRQSAVEEMEQLRDAAEGYKDAAAGSAADAKKDADRAERIVGGDFVTHEEVGAENGVASLDANKKVPYQQLPVADSGPGAVSEPGILKLYGATGSQTDGAMTVKATTDALNGKASSTYFNAYPGRTWMYMELEISSTEKYRLQFAETSKIPSLDVWETTNGTDWEMIASFYGTKRKPSPSDIGALAVNGKAVSAGTADRVLFKVYNSFSELDNDISPTGAKFAYIEYVDGVDPDSPELSNNINCAWNVLDFSFLSTRRAQIAFNAFGNRENLYFRQKHDSTWHGWYRLTGTQISSVNGDVSKDTYVATISSEVQSALLTAQINSLTVDDDTALRWYPLYPEWSAGTEYAVGYKARHGDRLYKCRQGHTSQAGWEPENTPALWEEICESHKGTRDDPIQYHSGMALENGKYYTEEGVLYRCTRDTVNPVYNPLAELVDLYVEAAE